MAAAKKHNYFYKLFQGLQLSEILGVNVAYKGM